MNKTCLLLLSLELFFGFSAFAKPAKINLSGSKGRVISAENRQLVLEVAKEYLDKTDSEFLAVINEVKNPYVAEEDEVRVVDRSDAEGAAPVRPVEPTVYDNASVLKAVAVSFSKQVRGTIAKGSARYLQLQGGGLLKPGVSFPVKLPEYPDQSFTVTLVDVDDRGYTLQLDDADLYVSFEQAPSQSSGAIKFTGE